MRKLPSSAGTMRRELGLIVYCAAFIASISGCSPGVAGKDPVVVKMGQTAQPSGFVIGRVIATEGGVPMENGSSRWLSMRVHSHLVIQPEGVARSFLVDVDDAGWLRLHQAPGTYRIISYVMEAGESGSVAFASVPIDRSYTLGGDDAAIYIGHLTIELNTDQVEFTDELVGAQNDWTQRKSVAGGQLVSRLAIPLEPVGHFVAVRSLCDPMWKVVCEKRNRGVDAVEPPVALTMNYPTRIQGLTPRLRWTSASDPDTRYDVAIWEGSVYQELDKHFTRGNLVYLREGLDQTEIVVEKPLKPLTQYMWGVRLRRGDIVSTWSKSGRIPVIPLILREISHGRDFTFQTRPLNPADERSASSPTGK